ncbi:MAG: ATP-binding protein [Bacteroidota bacterium]|nr:ATP-binding protein [Bacteroidota bacterium]
MKESKEFLQFIKDKHPEEYIQDAIGNLKAQLNGRLPVFGNGELNELFNILLNEYIAYSPEKIPTSTVKLNSRVLNPTTIAAARDSAKKALINILPLFTTNITEAVSIIKQLDEYALKSKNMYIEYLGEKIKEKEIALHTAEEKSKITIQESNTFAYAASHDLQEPLRMVTSYLQLLTNKHGENLDEEAQEFIRFAMDGSARMRDLINGLLQYSRLNKAGEFRQTKLDDALSEAIRNLEEQIVSTHTTIQREPLPEMLGEHLLLTQLFQHILANAIKFKSDQPPAISIGITKTQDSFTISIKDNGIGIDPKYTEKVFVIFQRLHSKSKYSGSGIGLALCKKITEMHGGTISVISDPGKGSVFHLTFKS